ncbi:MAG: polyphosphate kinase 2 family protein [Vulcanimicrobiaceae bacterium]
MEVRNIEDYRKRFFVDPDERVKLRKVDASYAGTHELAAAADSDTARFRDKLTELQQLLYASRQASLLVVLQGLDGAGKDGTVHHVMSAFNPQGATVTGFKVPTADERAHDFLWRVHPHAPGRGSIAIFNRSHYEDVLVTRVHGEIDADTCERRYANIRAFEKLLVANGTRILKFFLHISQEEQLQRFARRLEDPSRNWKISDADYAERRFWDEYLLAYDDALRATSRTHAPWYVVPANHKWFRNLVVSQIVADTLADVAPTYPRPTVDLDEIREKYHAAAADR